MRRAPNIRGHRRPPRDEDRRAQALYEEAARDPAGLAARVRQLLDGRVLAWKREMAARGLDRDHVLALTVNPRVAAAPGEVMAHGEPLPRAELLAGDDPAFTPAARADLARPPRPGHVWVYVLVPHHRALTEEPVEYTVTAHGGTPSAGDA